MAPLVATVKLLSPPLLRYSHKGNIRHVGSFQRGQALTGLDLEKNPRGNTPAREVRDIRAAGVTGFHGLSRKLPVRDQLARHRTVTFSFSPPPLSLPFIWPIAQPQIGAAAPFSAILSDSR